MGFPESMGFLRKLLAVLALAAIGLGGYLYFRSDAGRAPDQSAPAASEGVPVTVAKVVRKSVPIVLRAIGNVQAYSTVAVKSRVDGQIFDAGFKEGQMVRKGDLLFTIDPRPFDAAERQAEATLARDKAQLEGARLDLTRYSQLAKSGFAAQQKYEESKTAVDSLEATVKADQASVETAKLNQSYTTIRSPIDGRTGSVLIHPGNLVKANDTNALVVINQIKPIYVSFSVPEQYLTEITGYNAVSPLRVEARLAGEDEKPIVGQLSFINNAVDMTTGTIMLKATFPNEDERLVPGAFVHVGLILKTLQNALVVPTPALQVGQKGNYVYVVGPDETAQERLVGGLIDLGTETVVTSGIGEGDRVVTDGQLRLRPGVRVAPAETARSAAPPAS